MALFWIGFLAITISIIAILTKMLSDYTEHVPSSATTIAPYIGRSNSSKVILQRFRDVKLTFENAMNTAGWNILRTGHNNTSIETIEAKEGWPLFIRTTSYFDAPPAHIFDAFRWENFDNTQKIIDPFYESSQLITQISPAIKIIRKTSKRPVIYKKREFFQAMLELKQDKNVNILGSIGLAAAAKMDRHNSSTDHDQLENDTLAKNTLISALMTVRLSPDIMAKAPSILENPDAHNYVSGFKDLIAWFTETEDYGTKLIICMRVDLGSDIPQWAFLTTVAATGVWSMKALKKLVDKDYSNKTSAEYTSARRRNQMKSKSWIRRVLSSMFARFRFRNTDH